MQFHAPAKINLSLRIQGKRPDGFHELDTLIFPLRSLFDTLTFTKSETFSLECDTEGVPTDDSNLVSRAHQLFAKETGTSAFYHILLEKRVPHGAGLGGGSSDAATTLLALNELENTQLPLSKLEELAAQIGSDVPVFLSQSAARCEGRGEIITPISLAINHDLVLFKPNFEIPTPWAYSQWKDSQEVPGFTYGPQSIEELTLVNDLERPVFEKHLFLGELKNYLLEQSDVTAAIMSGSGSTVFAVLSPSSNAQELIQRTLQATDPTLWHHHDAR